MVARRKQLSNDGFVRQAIRSAQFDGAVGIFWHSMGGFLVMEAVRQLKLQHREDVIDKLAVILDAPDINVDVFSHS